MCTAWVDKEPKRVHMQLSEHAGKRQRRKETSTMSTMDGCNPSSFLGDTGHADLMRKALTKERAREERGISPRCPDQETSSTRKERTSRNGITHRSFAEFGAQTTNVVFVSKYRNERQISVQTMRAMLCQITLQNAQSQTWFAALFNQCDSFIATCGGF